VQAYGANTLNLLKVLLIDALLKESNLCRRIVASWGVGLLAVPNATGLARREDVKVGVRSGKEGIQRDVGLHG
jgi:hypothetical protein